MCLLSNLGPREQNLEENQKLWSDSFAFDNFVKYIVRYNNAEVEGYGSYTISVFKLAPPPWPFAFI